MTTTTHILGYPRIGEKRELKLTHMFYSEFNEIIDSVAALDADVITMETSRSNMELLEAFESFNYPNAIGLGVYDIHSPNIPSKEWIIGQFKKAAEKIPTER